ncbi:hypothetical protein AMTR_s00110p00131070 [Amborella trichopoda]|uniref:Zuotin-like zuotin homology domain-containing protein n=1 Tax=Amborella trichopoda TaxID=13333 RepID=W1NXH2_AMBTC|nr:hypothetical protein AMTR_s00110p00131070 [Amborella trichopoda]
MHKSDGMLVGKPAPLLGNLQLQSSYSRVSNFYHYWTRFATVMDFSWVDQHGVSEGDNRKKTRNHYNETVRCVTEFVGIRDERMERQKLQAEKWVRKRQKKCSERKRKIERGLREQDLYSGQES